MLSILLWLLAWLVFADTAHSLPATCIRLVAVSEVNGNPWISAAEINVLDSAGQPLSQSLWTLISVDSEEVINGDYRGINAIDDFPGTIWHTEYFQSVDPPPHRIDIDLGSPQTVTGLDYLPRQDSSINGTIAQFEVYVSQDCSSWLKVAEGTWAANQSLKSTTFDVSGGNATPVVTVTAPPDGSSFSTIDVVTLTGTAIDAEDGDLSSSLSWSSSLDGSLGSGASVFANLSDGIHTITATVTDSGGLGDSDGITVTVVAPPSDPSQVGQWSAPFTNPVVAVHMMLLNTGKVLMWDDDTTLWDPSTGTTGTFTPVFPGRSLFCSSQTTLADGRAFAPGGGPNSSNGAPEADIFDPTTEFWTQATPMVSPRWYPTATTLPDGRVLVVSGSIDCSPRPNGVYDLGLGCIADIPEVYSPVTNTWTSLTNPNARVAIPLYPFMFVHTDGRVWQVGSVETNTITRALDIATQTWATVDSNVVSGGSAAMFRPGQIIKAGSPAIPFGPLTAAVNDAYVLDMDQPSPSWRAVGSMAFPRAYHTLTVLPDGNVIVTGGTPTTEHVDTAEAVLQAEIWNVDTETWSTMASQQIPRSYHGNALLLPDGRVLVSGSGHGGGPIQLNAEIFSPPYLFKGPRPSIISAPQTIQYGPPNFFVGTPPDTDIASVALIRPGAATHGFDSNQRYIDLAFQPVAGGLDVQAPASANLAPPGDYMLFIVNTNGVPSVAWFVNIPVPSAN